MIFEIIGERAGGETKNFLYDNELNIISADGVPFEYPVIPEITSPVSIAFDKDHPLHKSKDVVHLKIQMGLSCNYSCDYCSQKFVERPPETTKADIDQFMTSLDVLTFHESIGLKIEFWGGEPFVYWKTMKPLAEALMARFSGWKRKPVLSVITNGSILNDEMIDWLMQHNFIVSISHDGPGQSVRGPDPFDDPEQKERLLGFYRMMTRLGKGFSFNAMLNSKNKSRQAIKDWFVELTGDPNVPLGEGGIVDAYDEDGISSSLNSLEEHFEFRRQSFSEILAANGEIGFKGTIQKLDDFTNSVLSHQHSKYLGQKCGMDSEHTLAVDLRGNVLTCQNVSAAETSKNDEPHLGGNLSDFAAVKLTSSTHWSNRDECAACPVLHLCKGACMFLDKKFWKVSCANSYSDNVALFALSFQKITGFIPTLIQHPDLPPERKDVFGTFLKHIESPRSKLSQIKVVNQLAGKIDDVEVYAQARQS